MRNISYVSLLSEGSSPSYGAMGGSYNYDYAGYEIPGDDGEIPSPPTMLR
jgi:hypothetical protein